MLGQLTVQQLNNILSDNNLNIDNEVLVWRALVAWIEYMPAERIAYFWSLFLQVRCQLMHSHMLKYEMARDFYLLNTKHRNVLSDKKTLAGQLPCTVYSILFLKSKCILL